VFLVGLFGFGTSWAIIYNCGLYYSQVVLAAEVKAGLSASKSVYALARALTLLSSLCLISLSSSLSSSGALFEFILGFGYVFGPLIGLIPSLFSDVAGVFPKVCGAYHCAHRASHSPAPCIVFASPPLSSHMALIFAGLEQHGDDGHCPLRYAGPARRELWNLTPAPAGCSFIQGVYTRCWHCPRKGYSGGTKRSSNPCLVCW